MAPVRALIVEDDELMRSGLAAGLTLQGIDVVGTAGDATSGRRLARVCRPDVAIIDLHLGIGPSGIDLAVGLRADHDRLGLILLTSYSDPQLAGSSMEVLPPGTRYCVKGDVGDVSKVATIVRECASDPVMGDVTVPAPQMSPEHMVILRLVATGASNAQIASAMNLSTKAIEYSIRRIAQQLDVPTKGEENPRVLLTRRYFELTGVSRE